MVKKIIISFIILTLHLLNGASASGEIECLYTQSDYGYSCTIVIQNPHVWDNYTKIEGEHLQNLSNDDVRMIVLHYNSYTTNIPKIFCDNFKNIEHVRFTYGQIEEISENSFKNCKNLKNLFLIRNKIERISENAFRENQQLEEVDFSYNEIKELPKNLFTSTNKLKVANFDKNFISIVHSETFGDQPELESLIFMDNLIDAFDEEILDRTAVKNLDLSRNICANSTIMDERPGKDEMRSVFGKCIKKYKEGSQTSRGLYCSYLHHLNGYTCTLLIINPTGLNNFTTINGEHFEESSDDDVRAILINGNSNSPIFPTIVCKKFKNIEKIYYSNSNVEEINDATFKDCQRLENIDFSRNKIKRISQNAFKENKYLSIVNFDTNNISELPKKLFTSSKELYRLNFRNNNIRIIHSDTFGEQSNLISIYLSKNNISAFDEKILDVTTITALDLTDNKCVDEYVTDISPGKVELHEKFRACFNDYQERETQILRCSYTIHTFGYMCYLFIDNPKGTDDFLEIDGDHQPGSTHDDVRVIALEYNSNSVIFPSIICEKFKNIERIFYTHSNIEEINDNSFKGCQKLQILALHDNQIRRISENAFRENKELSEVVFAYNKLTELPKNLFTSISSLTAVDFIENNIRIVHSETFGSQPSLNIISLSFNNLIAFDREILSNTNVSIVNLIGNACVDGSIEDKSSGRAEMREMLANCFRIYREIEYNEAPAIESYGVLNPEIFKIIDVQIKV